MLCCHEQVQEYEQVQEQEQAVQQLLALSWLDQTCYQALSKHLSGGVAQKLSYYTD